MSKSVASNSAPIYKYWKDEYASFLFALNYFKRTITRCSPNKIVPRINPTSKYDRYDLGIDESLLVWSPLGDDVLKDMTIDALRVYQNHSNLSSTLEYGDIIGRGVQGTVHEMFFDFNGHHRRYALKKMPIVSSKIYAKHVLLEEYWQATDIYDKQIIFNEILRHLRSLDQEEEFYFQHQQFSHLKRIIHDLIVVKNIFPILSDHGYYSKELEQLKKFYKYICLNNIILPFSDANNDVIVSHYCSTLVLEKMSPSFPLVYCSFKTNESFPFKQEQFNLCENIKNKCGKQFRRRVYPQQFMAMEKLDMTLYELVKGDMFDIKTQELELICERYLEIYSQIIIALLTAQKKYGYVNNDLHLNNIMIHQFKGPICYVLNENDLEHADIIFPLKKFPRNKNGDIILELKINTGLCKIIDNGRATLRLHDIEIGSNTDIFNARAHKVQNYNPRNFNNDLLKFFISMYDEDFFMFLFDRYEEGLSSALEEKILRINDEVFFCHNGESEEKDIFDIFEECGSNEQCNEMFYQFGMFGFGNTPKCDVREQRTPDNLIKYLDHLCRPNIRHKKLKMCFKMI